MKKTPLIFLTILWMSANWLPLAISDEDDVIREIKHQAEDIQNELKDEIKHQAEDTQNAIMAADVAAQIRDEDTRALMRRQKRALEDEIEDAEHEAFVMGD